MLRMHITLVAVSIAFLIATQAAKAAPWITADWAGSEPSFPPGSLYWQTDEYQTCPVLFRTVLDVESKPVSLAGFRALVPQYAYVFLNGRQITTYEGQGEGRPEAPLAAELTHLLRPGRNVFIVSTSARGFALQGVIAYRGGARQSFGSDPGRWKVQKFAPLTMLEYEPCMRPDFDDSKWFSVKQMPGRKSVAPSIPELEEQVRARARDRLQRLDQDGLWRLQMLRDKGIVIADWEAHGWSGSTGRFPDWMLKLADPKNGGTQVRAGAIHTRAEALTRYVLLADEVTNLANQAAGLQALGAPEADVAACRNAAEALEGGVKQVEAALRSHRYDRALAAIERAEPIVATPRQGRPINRLNAVSDNKFGWFDTGLLEGNDIGAWGLRVSSPASIFASPLSPAALITLSGTEFSLEGWGQLQPWRVYDKQVPAVGPVAMWAVAGGKLVTLKPNTDGTVYDRAQHGKLSENWILLVNDLSRGGGLPVQLVFLRAPDKIVFLAGEKGTTKVTVSFSRPGERLFALRPLKEWRGFLEESKVLTADLTDPRALEEAQPYVDACRLWSRAVLNYPVTFSEVLLPDPADRWSLRVADIYNYLESQDEWDTQALRLAPLPPLASYGLMVGYPGLSASGDAKTFGSRGIWGDYVAVAGSSHIAYRIPVDRIRRFGGFTAYCYGPTDIGGPGGMKEIEAVKRTGANSWRPQHNQTGEAAMRTLQWCWEQGLQNVFNADEKWILDVVEHYRTLARACKGYPPDAVAYDLLNEPETRDPTAYNALVRKITTAIREIDETHLIYYEVIPQWGIGAKPYPEAAFRNLEPTGDDLTCYSFHDYENRLEPRWPNQERDVRTILARWIPALRYSIAQHRPIHLGEFGAFEQTEESVFDNRCAETMMLDYLKVFDQFGWHWQYYSNRGICRVRSDGSLAESYVQAASRRYFARGTFNVHYPGRRELPMLSRLGTPVSAQRWAPWR